jgi:hypothetical protein
VHSLPLVLALAALLAAGAGARAGEAPPSVGEVMVPGHPPAACPLSAQARGPDYACLNRQLQTAAGAAQPPVPTIDAAAREAQSPSRAGTFSQAATAERLGKNFGVSARPYRPAPPAYAQPITAGRPR